MIVNKSGLVPKGRVVLVEPYELERKKGMIVLTEQAKSRGAMLEQRAIVVAIGPGAWADEKEPRAVIGEKVFVSGFAGFMVVGPADGKQYRAVNCNDIFLGISEEIENG